MFSVLFSGNRSLSRESGIGRKLKGCTEPVRRLAGCFAIAAAVAMSLSACERSENKPPAKASTQGKAGAESASNTRAFLPSRNGFAFANNFPGTPLPSFLGGTASGNSAFGLCGGMTAASADYFLAGLLPPRTRELPQRGSALYEYLFLRQAESIGPGIVTAGKFAEWMSKPNAELEVRSLSELAALETRLKEHPIAPIGLILAGADGKRDIRENHQVLALGIEREGSAAKIAIYDPNFPEDDSVRIELRSTSGKEPIGRITRAGTSKSMPVRGFFVLSYQSKLPPAISLP